MSEENLPTAELLQKSRYWIKCMNDSPNVGNDVVRLLTEVCIRLERLEKETWLSPIESERKQQEDRLRKIWPGYPEVQFQHQTLNGLLNIAEDYFRAKQ